MKKIARRNWHSMFDVLREDTDLPDGRRSIKYYIVDKVTGEKIFPPTRSYGYGNMQDACRGAAQLYNSIQKSIEEDLLGQKD